MDVRKLGRDLVKHVLDSDTTKVNELIKQFEDLSHDDRIICWCVIATGPLSCLRVLHRCLAELVIESLNATR